MLYVIQHSKLINFLFLFIFRPSMSHGTGLGLERGHERDFVLSTTEEFVKKFNGTRAINKVSLLFSYREGF